MVESGGEEWEWLVCSASRPGQGLKNGTTTRRRTRRDSRKGTLQDDGIDSMLACWGTVWGKHVLPADRSARAAVSILHFIFASGYANT